MEIFQTIQPSALLMPYVKQYWLMKSDSGGHTQGIVPTGYISMYFHRASPLLSIERKETNSNSKKIKQVAVTFVRYKTIYYGGCS